MGSQVGCSGVYGDPPAGQTKADRVSPLPDFVAPVKTAVSGRLMCMGAPGTGDPDTPAVLEAHLLPGLIGSSVYVLGAVGPSDSSWPYYPLCGVMVSGREELTLLGPDDDTPYYFAAGVSLEWDDEPFDYEPVEEPEDLIQRVLAFAAEALHLQPWNDELMKDKVEECNGYDHFDQFMALPTAEFPSIDQLED